MGAGEIPVASAPDRHGHVGFLGAALDLVEDLLAQIRQMAGVRLGERVLRLEVGGDLRIVLVAQPFVVVDDGVAVMGALRRDLLGDRRCRGLALVDHETTSAVGQSAKDFCAIHS